MSGSLDKLTPQEEAQLKQMEQDDIASAAQESAQPERQLVEHDAEPQTAADPKQVEQEAREQPEEAPEPRLVDKKALDAERERRRRIEKEFQEEKVRNAAEFAKAQTRLDMLSQASQEYVQRQQAPAPQAAEQAPDFNVDPAGWIRWDSQRKDAELAALRAQVNQSWQQQQNQTQAQQRAQQEQAARDELAKWGNDQEIEFAREQPDYLQAVEHLKGVRIASINAMGVTHPEQVRMELERDALNTAHFARQNGRHFAETLYALAKATGYRPGQQSAPQAQQSPQEQSAAAPIVARQAPQTAAERLVRGQEMANTLGQTGSAPRGTITVEAIARMNDAEFDAYYNNIRKNGVDMRQVFGA